MISPCLRKNSRRKVMAGKPDEERNYRALIEDTEKPPALKMVKAITGSIDQYSNEKAKARFKRF